MRVVAHQDASDEAAITRSDHEQVCITRLGEGVQSAPHRGRGQGDQLSVHRGRIAFPFKHVRSVVALDAAERARTVDRGKRLDVGEREALVRCDEETCESNGVTTVTATVDSDDDMTKHQVSFR